MPQSLNEIMLTADERAVLEALARTGRGRADLAGRARIILRLAAGASYGELIALGESSRLISGSNASSTRASPGSRVDIARTPRPC